MRRLARLLPIFFVCIAFLISGCQSLNDEKDIDLESAKIKYLLIPTTSSERQVTFTATSDVPIIVVAVLGGQPDENADLTKLKEPLGITKEATKEVNMTFKVPAKQDCTICLATMKKAKVHYKLTGK